MKKISLKHSILAIYMAMISSFAFSQAVNTPIDAQTGVFTATFDITPSHDNMNAAVGFSEGEIAGWGDMSSILIVTNDGTFGARNGGDYEYMSLFPAYEAGKTYSVVMTVDVVNNTYSATVKAEGGFETTVAYNFAFRAAATSIDNLFSYNNNAEAWGGIIGASLDISNYELAADVTSDDYFAIEPSIHKNFAIPAQTGNVICEFDVTPTVDSINAAVSLNNAPSMANPGWSAMSPIVSFNSLGTISCRNGDAYEDAATPYVYTKDETYHIKMELNIVGNIYDVYITNSDSVTTLIADDFAFRNATQELNYRVITSVNGDQSELFVSKFDIYSGDQELNTPIVAQSDVFTATFDITPSHDNMNAAVGFSDGSISGWGDMSTILIVSEGVFGARNGDSYDYMTVLPMEANETYSVVMTVDVVNNTYSATVKPEGGFETTMAYNFAFRKAATSLDNFFSYNNEAEAWGGVPGASLDVSNFILADTVTSNPYFAVETEKSQSFAIPAQTGNVICEFDVILTVDSANCAISLNNAPSTAWGDMSTIIRFGELGTIDCRNGEAYEDAATPYEYSKDQMYHIKMELNIIKNTYDVYITNSDSVTTLIADDFAFRNATEELNYRVITSNNGDQSEILVSNFDIYDGEQELNTPIVAQSDVFTATFDITPSHDNMNAAVGFSEGAIAGWGDMSSILIVSKGVFGARNGDSYDYMTVLPMEANETYSVVMTVDVVNNTYSATVKPKGGFETTLAYNFGFRVAADTIDNFFSYNNNAEAWGGVPGASLDVSNFNLAAEVTSEDYFAIESSIYKNFAIPAQTGNVICEFDVTPTADSIICAFSLNNEPSLVNPAGWSAMSPILSFNDQGTMNCRNGDAYEDAATPYVYTKDQAYHIKMEVNIVGNVYDVYITNSDSVTTLIADDFAFRNATQELNYRVITSVSGDQSELFVTNFDIYNGALDYSELISVIDSSKTVVGATVVVGLAEGEYFQATIDAANVAIATAEAVNGTLKLQAEVYVAADELRAAMGLYTPNMFDYTLLGSVVDSCRTIIDAGVIGNDPGEYKMTVTNAANIAVSKAKTVLAGVDSKAEIDQAIADLRAAIVMYVPNEETAVIDVLDASFAMYPNPVNDVLYIKNIAEVKSLSIYNSAGIEISVYSNNAESMSINLDYMNAGLYIVKFRTEDNVCAKRFIKN